MGTWIRIVETASKQSDNYTHNNAVAEVTNLEVENGFVVVSAHTVVTVVEYHEVLRTTTIVFAPGT